MTLVRELNHGGMLGGTPVDTAIQPYSFISAGTGDGDGTLIVAGPVNAYLLTCSNVNPTVRYFKVYDKATAPDNGDTPVLRFAVAPDCGVVGFAIPAGVHFALGLGFRLTTGSADNDSSEVAAGELIVNAAYAAA